MVVCIGPQIKIILSAAIEPDALACLWLDC